MSGDYSRKRFNPQNHYSGVLQQQGRVALDADGNENVDLQDRRWRAETIDVVGRCGVPSETPDGFKIGEANGNLLIGPGRMYVDGLLAENHGVDFDFLPHLEEKYGSKPVLIKDQPYFPGDEAVSVPEGRSLVYLDVWKRELTHLQKANLIEPAVGVDATTRNQTVWQVKVFPEIGDEVDCETPLNHIKGWPEQNGPSGARLSSDTVPVDEEDDPCLLPPTGGYRGTENQLYRVQAHDVKAGKTRIKWSRDNASVASRVLEILPGEKKIRLDSLGRDDGLSFKTGNWVEITNDLLELRGVSGAMRQVTVNETDKTLEFSEALLTPELADQPGINHLRVIRWDQTKNLDDDGLIPLDSGDSVTLENGIQVTLDFPTNLKARPGDSWLIPARTTDTSIEILDQAPPESIHHHYCGLAIVEFANGSPVGEIDDCRKVFQPLTEIEEGCCTVVVMPGEDIQAAIDSLPREGGCVCIKTGVHEIEDVLKISGSNIKLTGESPGSIIRRQNGVAMLKIESPGVLPIRSVTIQNIKFDSKLAGVPPNSAQSELRAVQAIFTENFVFRDCSITSVKNSTFNIGIYLAECTGVTIHSCNLLNFSVGIWTEEESRQVSLADNNIQLAAEKIKKVGAGFGILIQETFGVCRILNNRINNYFGAIVVNDEVGKGTSGSSADGSIIQNNEIIGMTASPAVVPEPGFLIDVAADDCLITGNRLSSSQVFQNGIRVLGDGCSVRENHVEFIGKPASSGDPTLGIMVGDADLKSSRVIEKTDVVSNQATGLQWGVFVHDAVNARIHGNKIDGQGMRGSMGIVLLETESVLVAENAINNSAGGILSVTGRGNKIVCNTLSQGTGGILLAAQSELDVDQNRVEFMESAGIFCLFAFGRTAFTGNRIQSCGYASEPAVGLGVLAAFGEVAVQSCYILDTGEGPKGETVSPAYGLATLFVREAQVEGNQITYSKPGDRGFLGEDRAVLMVGLFEFRFPVAARNLSVGFGAQVNNNKFIGTGLSALVQVLGVSSSNSNMLHRFERIIFNNNDCRHYSSDKSKTSVDLNASSSLVIGNHIKAGPGVPPVDFHESNGVFMGNDVQAAPKNFTTGPKRINVNNI